MDDAAKQPCPQDVVLVVDDDPDIRDLVSGILQANNYQAIDAANGLEAIDRLHTSGVRPCVILLDIMMPVMDGWRFRMLQRKDPDPRIACIPVVVLTAHATPEEVNRRMRTATVLRKPFKVESLLNAIGQYCHKDAGTGNRSASPAIRPV